jgi:hypothetical protein
MAPPEDRLISRGYGRGLMSARRALRAILRGVGTRARVVGGFLACLAVLAAANGCGSEAEESGLPAPPPARLAPITSAAEATLTVARSAAVAIPSSFFGLSTEYWTLPVDLRYTGLYRRMISLLRVPGDTPFVLRIGGDSSDHTFYAPVRHRMPSWTFAMTTAFVQRTAAVVRSMKLHVILDLNLVTGNSRLAAAWAREAETVMPKGSVVGFEVGNEPDLYERSIWLRLTGEPLSSRVLPRDITAASYARDFARYAHALRGIAPPVDLLGPALSHPRADAGWISALLRGPHPGLRVISVHEYPYSACAFPGTSSYPTIKRILSQRASAGLAASVWPSALLARRAGLPLRVTEFNSVTCGGLPGVSNTFATALWAPDAGFELLRIGARSIELHAREYTVNDPFTFNSHGVEVHPLLYGLIMFVRTLSPHAQLLHSQLRLSGGANLKAWAVRSAHGSLNVLVIDKGPRDARVTMNLPAEGVATVQRLLAHSPRARGGVTLAGQWLDRDGDWRGHRVIQRLAARARRYHLWMPRYSAALVTVPVAPARS